MLKHIYKIVAIVVVFFGSLYFFMSTMGGKTVEETKAVEMGKETFPILSVETQGQTINDLYGYTGSMPSGIVRESVTPVGKDKQLIIHIQDGESTLQKLQYEIRDADTDEVLASRDLNAISKDAKDKKTALLEFDYPFETSQEYVLRLIGITDTGRKINYYTRMKYYIDDSYLDGKIKFALDFNALTFDKENVKKTAAYLEPQEGKDNSTLAYVDIHSDSDLITWAKLDPKKITTIVPTIKEYNMETACIQLNYFIQAKTSTGKEIYQVKEFYRVRYTTNRYYLLAFERTVDALFNKDLASLTRNQLKVGITGDTELEKLYSEDEKIVCFARNDSVYYYDLSTNVLNKVFSFFSTSEDYSYKKNNEQSLKLIKMNNTNDIYFVAYGYIPRGDYEGKVGAILYEYHAKDNYIEELLYMPLDTTYQMLKQDFEDFSYVNDNDVFYFSISNVVYSYNLLAKQLDVVAENVTENNFKVLNQSHCFVYTTTSGEDYGDSITIYNLDKDLKEEIKPKKKTDYVRLLGTIDSNIVYGLVKKKDISKSKDGSEIIPCYEMRIVDMDQNVLKVYKEKNHYISDASVEDDILTIKRLRKSGNSFVEEDADTILNQKHFKKEPISMTYRVAANYLTEYYITLPDTFVMNTVPELVEAKNKVMTKETALHLETSTVVRYYVYTYGRIMTSYESPAKAIIAADKAMGVVISSKYQLVWERSGAFKQNTIAGIEVKRTGNGVSSLAACCYMLLKNNHITLDVKDLAGKKNIYDMIKNKMESPVNLSGCTLEEVLYFVSFEKPCVAMRSKNSAILIIGYTQQTLTYIDPTTGQTVNMPMLQAKTMFEAAGNKFVSYMK